MSNDEFDLARDAFLEGVTLMSSHHYENAETCFLKSLSIIPDRTSTLINLVIAQISQGKHDQASLYANKITEIDGLLPEGWLYLALSSKNLGNLEYALNCIDRVIKISPTLMQGWLLKIDILSAKEDYDELLKTCDLCLQIAPEVAEIWCNKADTLVKLNKCEEAVQSYDQALLINSSHIDAILGKALCLNIMRDFSRALLILDAALQLDPSCGLAWSYKALTLEAIGDHDLALEAHQTAIDATPNSMVVKYYYANFLLSKRDYPKASELYSQVISLNPLHYQALVNRGICLKEIENLSEASASFAEAVKIAPNFFEGWVNQCALLLLLGDYKGAVFSAEKSLMINSKSDIAWLNKANALSGLGMISESLDAYNQAINLNPNLQEGWANKANALNLLARYEEAIHAYEKALELNPNIDWAHGSLVHAQMRICDWRQFNENQKTLAAGIETGRKIINPFPLLALTDNPTLHKKSAEIFTAAQNPANNTFGPLNKLPIQSKIRVGYFSADFRNHAVASLIAELFELHNRERFEIIAFSYGPDDGSPLRQRIANAFDKFIDISNLSNYEAAKLAREIELNIAIDLTGFTQNSRTNIFSYRIAPIQINYLGYPGTLGANYIDYIITDHIITPLELQQSYTEKVVNLPNSYQANDRKRPVSKRKWGRLELGLPEQGFVFCCFNNNFKILPNIFKSWMKILNAVDGSVLWLFEDNQTAANNLKNEALRAGIAPTRLVFAKAIASEDHLARLQLADLFLDTFPYNAHTTASDALWVGVPVLTLLGNSFASRVAASLLHATQLPELISNTLEEYEFKAIKMATNPMELASIKNRLVTGRVSNPLFNTPLFTKDFELLLLELYKQHDYC